MDIMLPHCCFMQSCLGKHMHDCNQYQFCDKGAQHRVAPRALLARGLPGALVKGTPSISAFYIGCKALHDLADLQDL